MTKFTIIFLILIICMTSIVQAQDDIRFRSDCEPGRSQAELNINNVRARLSHSGAMFNDHGAGSYEVPKSELGEESGASAIYAAGVWVGGLQNSNFKVAAVKTGLSQGDTDWYPGPLDEQGEISSATCANWDKHFEVLGEDISNFIDLFEAQGGMVDVTDIHESLLGWPSKDNPHFSSIHGFDLPDSEEFASYYDHNFDGIYNPLDGDYPIIGTNDLFDKGYADQMIYWVYNDNGNFHAESNGSPMRIEVHQLSYAFISDNAINDMTFHKFTLINRSPSDIDSMYFGFWSDPDLGCSEDDYYGSSQEDSLVYVYNQDAVDGDGDCDCMLSQFIIPTYCTEVPMIGMAFLNAELSSFSYVKTFPVSGNVDPNPTSQYYNALSGSWGDGTPLTRGGDGCNPGSTDYVDCIYSDPPDDNEGWSLCTAALDESPDQQLLQSTSIGKLEPNERKTIFMGVYFTPNIGDYPCPSIDPLLQVDSLARVFSTSGFDISAVVATKYINSLDVNYYPNPTSGIFYLDMDHVVQKDYILNIIDFQGRIMLSETYEAIGLREINTTQLSPGAYIIQVISIDGTWSDILTIN